MELPILWSVIDIPTHANSPDFHRLVVTVQGIDGKYIPFAFVQYRFDGNEHFVSNKPHGNAKSKDPFIPTKKSTLEKLTAVVKTQGVKGSSRSGDGCWRYACRFSLFITSEREAGQVH